MTKKESTQKNASTTPRKVYTGTLESKPAQKNWKYVEFREYASGSVAIKFGSKTGGFYREYVTDTEMNRVYNQCEKVFRYTPKVEHKGQTLIVKFSHSFLRNHS